MYIDFTLYSKFGFIYRHCIIHNYFLLDSIAIAYMVIHYSSHHLGIALSMCRKLWIEF